MVNDISQKCLEILEQGITAVEEKYFHFPISSNNQMMQIYRERVYCYELYHQIRILQKQMSCDLKQQIDINGEPDKRGHIWINNGCNPDMIFHKAGTMTKNYLVVEVKNNLNGKLKNNENKPDGVYKDFINLYYFIAQYQYQKGCFHLYGLESNNKEKLTEIVKNIFLNDKYNQHVLNNIIIMLKQNSKSDLIKLNVLDMLH